MSSYGYFARAFNIYPSIKPRLTLLPSGKMVFDDKVENAARLVELLNKYILQHGIAVEIANTFGGKSVPAPHL